MYSYITEAFTISLNHHTSM